MEINQAKQLLSTLAEGIDPITGELLPQGHVCNNVEIVRALYTLINAAKSKPANAPVKAGAPWTKEDEQLLRKMFNDGITIESLSTHFQRSKGSIHARLVRLGLITEK